MLNEGVKEKIKATNIEKYGCENPNQNKEVREKIKQTNIMRYGTEYPTQNEEVREKSKATNIVRFGHEHPMQNQEVMEAASKNAYKIKTFVLPSGKELKCQGYEPYGLKRLLEIENIEESDIITGPKNVPHIWYEDENQKKHRHYVDIFIPSQNRCIEIKSTWTFAKKQDNIFLKQTAGKLLGYKYEIWVFDGKGEITTLYE
jgi:hypothetical protein